MATVGDFPGPERRSSEIASLAELQTCVRDLMRLLALPALCNGRDAESILALLCETLESALALEACYVCARAAPEDGLACALRIRGAFVEASHPAWRSFVDAAGQPHSGPPTLIDDTPVGALRMLSYDMGFCGEGSVCVASADPDFPSPRQSLVLQAAITLSASALNAAQLRRDKDDADRAREDFLAALSHELRNPLAPIMTALDLTRLRSGETALPREHQIIERQIERLTRLAGDISDVSRLARGKIELVREVVEIGDLVAKAVELAGPLVEQRHHSLRVEAPATGLLVDGDPARLAHALAHLVTNAAKFTEQGGHIGVSAWRDGDEIRIAVSDDGAGIDPERVPHVFDTFAQRRTDSERQAGGGLGVGLSIVRAIVRLHGGAITAASAGRGHGAEFTIALPAHERAERTGAAPQAAPSAARGDRVVVVDDNRDAAELVAAALSTVGHDVTIAGDALQAISLIAKVKPDVVVLDIGMPVMDGHELAARIRREFGDKGPRLVAVTGFGLDQDRARSREAGIDTHLVKPVDVKTLIAAVAGGVKE
jgi:signal transduction histidine kinase/CheY-like chemotaxis protein